MTGNTARHASRFGGKIKLWKDDKGYGFIVPDAGGSDVFAHISQCGGKAPAPDTRVSYELGRDQRTGKVCAIKVATE